MPYTSMVRELRMLPVYSCRDDRSSFLMELGLAALVYSLPCLHVVSFPSMHIIHLICPLLVGAAMCECMAVWMSSTLALAQGVEWLWRERGSPSLQLMSSTPDGI